MDDIERLKVAFGLDMLRRVAAADGRVDDREWDLIEKAWPDGTLQRLGFVDEDGPRTEANPPDMSRSAESSISNDCPLKDMSNPSMVDSVDTSL